MAAFVDPFANLPGIVVQKQDGNLNPFRQKEGPVTVIIGTSPSGPANTLVEVDRVSEALALFGTTGTLGRGLTEASQGGADNLAAFRIGAEAALLRHVGDHAGAAGITIETVDADGSVADDFSVLYEDADVVSENGAVFTKTTNIKRLRIYDSAGVLIYDNDPVGGVVVDSGDVLVSGTAPITLQGPSIGNDIVGRAVDQHNGFLDTSDLDAFTSAGARFDSMGFNAATAPMKLLIDKSLDTWEEINIIGVTGQDQLDLLAPGLPAASDCEETAGITGEDDEITNQPLAADTLQINGQGAAGNGLLQVTVYGINIVNGVPIAVSETLAVGAAGVVGAVGTVSFTTVTGAELDGTAAGILGVGGVIVERSGSGEDLIRFVAADGLNPIMGLDRAPGINLFGGVGVQVDAGAAGTSCVVRGPSITPLLTMPGAAAAVTLNSSSAADNGKVATVFGYNAAGDPISEAETLNNGASPSTGALFASITGIAVDHQLTGTLQLESPAATSLGASVLMAAASRELNIVTDVLALTAVADEAGLVSGTAKFSNIWQVELGDIPVARTVIFRKLRMYRIVSRSVGETMSVCQFANDGHASTSFLAADTTTGRGITTSAALQPGADGLAPDKEKLFELLQEAYRNLETAPIDICVPMDVYLDDLNIGDDASLVRSLATGADGQFLATPNSDADAFGRLLVFRAATGSFQATLGIAGPNQATLVITEPTWQEAAVDVRRSAKVIAAGDLNGLSLDTALTLDRPLLTLTQSNLDWELIGNGAFGTQPLASDHLRYFRQYKLNGEWLYEWHHEANKLDVDGDLYAEVNFGYQLANFCYQLSTNDNNTLGVIGVNVWDSKRKQDIDLWIGTAPVLDATGAVATNGTGLLGNKYLSGQTGWTRGMFAVTGDDLANYPDSVDIIVDTNGNSVDIGRSLSVVAAWPNFINTFDATGFGYVASGAPVYGGRVSKLDPHSAPTNKILGRGVRMPIRLKKNDRNSLAGNRLVWFDVRDKGTTVDDAPTASLATSDYARLTTIRIVNAAVDEVRNVAEPFIGEAHTAAVRAALKTAIDKRLSELQKLGMLRRYETAVSATPTQQILGQATIELVLVPAFELRKINVLISLAAE